MCRKNLQKSLENNPSEDMEEDSDSSSVSDVSVSDPSSSQSDNELEETASSVILNTELTLSETVSEDEDETVKAIINECRKESDHPPSIQCDDFITDISFHPQENLLAIATVVGDVLLYRYSNEENILLDTLELHTKACRDIEYSYDGRILFSISKDKSVMLTDVETRKLIRFYDEAHDVPINSLCVIDENLFATGDDDGMVKLWDLRHKGEQVWKTKKNEDYISDMLTNECKKYLICSSGDGSITTIDLRNRKVHMQSEEYDEDLTCLGLFRSESKLLACSSKGKLYLYNWEEFGLHSDVFPGLKVAINDLVPITENIVVTACEDGNLRAIHLFPHRHLGIVGQHELSIENVDICNSGQFIASTSHNNDVRFWNIQYFEDFEKDNKMHKKQNRTKELKNNLPSSKLKNASDFFSGLC